MAEDNPPSLPRLAAAADELRRREFARLSDALTPRIEALRSMTLPAFREVVALMLERFGHTIITDPAAADLVTLKAGQKFIIACATPVDAAPTAIPALRRLHDAVIAASARRGFYVTARSFTAAAEQYAESAPIDLVDGKRLVRALNQGRKGVLLPQTYKAMCRQCGAIVEHRIDRDQDEARPCGNGHLVPPSIARAMLIAPRPAVPDAPGQPPQGHRPRPKVYGSAKARVRAHNRVHNGAVRARAIRQQHEGE